MASVEQQVQISPEDLVNSVAKEDAALGVRRYFTIAGRDPFAEIDWETRDELLRALQRQLAGKGPGAPVVARAAGGGVPVPLVVLGAVALLLLAASLGGTAWRRFQARRDR